MQIIEEELPGNILQVTLDGRLDIEGASSVDLKMNLIAGSRNAVLVDLQRASRFSHRLAFVPSLFRRGRSKTTGGKGRVICTERDG